MEKIVEQTILYDFYGELLNEHQKEMYEEYVLDNFSLSEIAQEHGISRQGVHDQIKRIDKRLADYEDKLHLVKRFMEIKEKVNHINQLSKQISSEKDRELVAEITKLTDGIIEEL